MSDEEETMFDESINRVGVATALICNVLDNYKINAGEGLLAMSRMIASIYYRHPHLDIEEYFEDIKINIKIIEGNEKENE